MMLLGSQELSFKQKMGRWTKGMDPENNLSYSPLHLLFLVYSLPSFFPIWSHWMTGVKFGMLSLSLALILVLLFLLHLLFIWSINKQTNTLVVTQKKMDDMLHRIPNKNTTFPPKTNTLKCQGQLFLTWPWAAMLLQCCIIICNMVGPTFPMDSGSVDLIICGSQTCGLDLTWVMGTLSSRLADFIICGFHYLQGVLEQNVHR